MASRLIPRSSPPTQAISAPATITRPADLVELSERVYRSIFGAGLYVATMTSVYAVALVFVQVGTVNRPLAAGVCVALAFGVFAAARRHVPTYLQLRRRPAYWMVALGLILSAAHIVIGAANQILFPPTLTLIAVAGSVVRMRWVFIAGLVVAAGQASPVLTDTLTSNEHRALLTAAAADVFIPLLFSVLITRLARFMLDLHRTITDLAAPRPATEPAKVRAWTMRDRSAPVAARDGLPHAGKTENAPLTSSRPAGAATITPRQLQAVALAAEGLSHAEIADCLGVTAGQVARLLANARARVGVITTQQLVLWAIAGGVLPDPG